jgi:dihydroorotate dehydrogenase (NAD+) catalytic subunit
MVDLSTSISGLRLANPTILASGVLGETGESLLSIADAKAGALVTKSIGLKPRDGHPNPTFLETQTGVLNAMGLPNPGIEEYAKEIEVALKGQVPVVGSIFGENPGEFSFLAKKMEEYGASAVELNLSCPHVRGFGAEIGRDPQNIENITRAAKDAVKIPIWIKLSPNVNDIAELAEAVQKGGGDAVVAINTVKAMAISPELARPYLASIMGGYSGPGIKPIGLRCVYEISKSTDIPVIGVGGILSGKDAIEYIMAGAHAVQIGSGVFYRRKEIFGQVCREIEQFMNVYGYNSIEEMVGIAHE